MAPRNRDYKAEYARRRAREAARGQRRDYKAEYEKRVRRLMALGLERSEARGHPRSGKVGAAELGQLRRASALASPSGWVEVGGVMTRGPAAGPDPERRAAADRVAEIAGVQSPAGMGRTDRVASVYAAEAFVEAFVRLGLGSEQRAYTLWFSP